jgi:hypothetical protein
MNIDVENLSEQELIDLNNKIVARLRFLQHSRAHSKMLEFKIGERVSFQPPGRPMLLGVLTRYNKKSVTVITDTGEHWNVDPGALRKVRASDHSRPEDAKVISFQKKP